MLNLIKVIRDAFCNLLTLSLSKFPSQPFKRIAIRFASIARMTSGNDIERDSTRTIFRVHRNPVIGIYCLIFEQSALFTAISTAIIPVYQTSIPVLLSKRMREATLLSVIALRISFCCRWMSLSPLGLLFSDFIGMVMSIFTSSIALILRVLFSPFLKHLFTLFGVFLRPLNSVFPLTQNTFCAETFSGHSKIFSSVWVFLLTRAAALRERYTIFRHDTNPVMSHDPGCLQAARDYFFPAILTQRIISWNLK